MAQIDKQTEARDTTSIAERFVIVGAGIAAVAAAQEIRKLHPAASIVMIGEENVLPYDHDAFYRHLLLPGAGETFSLRPPEWYSVHGIFLLSGRRVMRLLPRVKELELSDGTVLHYDKCILATGAAPILPDLEGNTLRGVFAVGKLNMDEREHLARYLRPDMRAVVVGGGASALMLAKQLYLGGCHVTVLAEGDRLLGGQVSTRVSDEIVRLAAQMGIEIRTSVHVTRLRGEDRVEQVILPGEYLNAEAVLFCVGSRPRISLAQEAGLDTDGGITVNSRMMTGKYGIYACGDCVSATGEVWDSARIAARMGRYAGRNAAGEDAMYRPSVPLLRMDAFGVSLIAVGTCADGEGIREEHRVSERGEVFLYRDGGRLCGAVILGDVEDAEELVRELVCVVNVLE